MGEGAIGDDVIQSAADDGEVSNLPLLIVHDEIQEGSASDFVIDVFIGIRPGESANWEDADDERESPGEY